MSRRRKPVWLFVAALAALPPADGWRAAGTESAGDDGKPASAWFREGRAAAQAAALAPAKGRPRNVILFVGDGMGVSTVAAARIFEGQRLGGSGEDHRLAFETLPYLALLKTYSVNQQVSDSASTMTALVTGVKTVDGALSVDARGQALTTLLEIFEKDGRSTGVVTTARLTHATPAACYAHIPDREAESDRGLPGSDRAGGAPDIARQLVEWGDRPGDGLEVALGGGRSRFLPKETADPEDASATGARRDGRDLTQEWTRRFPRAAYVWNAPQLDAVDASRTDHLLGLFDPSHMHHEADRPSDKAGEPSLARMTLRALDVLRRNRRGYFLMVEGGRIDHAHHEGNAHRALDDTIAFAAAVAAARGATRADETLIVVTADHSHVMTFGGYPQRGNPILGLSMSGGVLELDRDGKPFTTLGYANGPGARPGERPDLREVDTTARDYRQEAAVPLRGETHAGEDVPLYAGGPGAHLFHGVLEQNVVFHLILRATGLQAPEPRR